MKTVTLSDEDLDIQFSSSELRSTGLTAILAATADELPGHLTHTNLKTDKTQKFDISDKCDQLRIEIEKQTDNPLIGGYKGG